MLKFNVKNQIIERNDDFAVVADSRNYLYAEFEFTEEWTGEITAIFGGNDQYCCVLLDEDNRCLVPWEVIKPPFFTVSVVCQDRITADTATVEVEKSGYAEGETPQKPTPDVYRQILDSTKSPYIGENGHWYIWNKLLGSFGDTQVSATGPQGAAGYAPQKGVDYWTDEDKAEIQGYINQQLGVIENGSY